MRIAVLSEVPSWYGHPKSHHGEDAGGRLEKDNASFSNSQDEIVCSVLFPLVHQYFTLFTLNLVRLYTACSPISDAEQCVTLIRSNACDHANVPCQFFYARSEFFSNDQNRLTYGKASCILLNCGGFESFPTHACTE